MLIFDMIYVNWVVKKEKSQGTLRRLSHVLDPLGFGAWQLAYELFISFLWKMLGTPKSTTSPTKLIPNKNPNKHAHET